jgi:hypothetical protein
MRLAQTKTPNLFRYFLSELQNIYQKSFGLLLDIRALKLRSPEYLHFPNPIAYELKPGLLDPENPLHRESTRSPEALALALAESCSRSDHFLHSITLLIRSGYGGLR